MKKSEMAKKMNNWANEICDSDNWQWESWGEAQWMQLLTRMEEAGMLPPVRVKPFHQVNDVAYVNYRVYEWEEE